jgi:hypothetical protein
MNSHRSSDSVTFAFALVLSLTVAAQADDQHKHGAPLHGGKVAMTQEYHFEVVFTKDGLKVYPRTHEDKPLDSSKLTGTATFYHPNSPKPWFDKPLTPTKAHAVAKASAPAASAGHAAESLEAKVDTSKVPASGAKVTIVVSGLPDKAEPTATITVPFVLAAKAEITVAKATKADEKAIAALKTCPVSKDDLNDMGGPLKVTRGDQSTFICCKACLRKIQADPDKYFGVASSAPAAKDEHDHPH